jgi:hypothetical protein
VLEADAVFLLAPRLPVASYLAYGLAAGSSGLLLDSVGMLRGS